MRIIAYAAEQSFQRVDRSASNAKRNMKSAGVTALFRLSTEKVSRTGRFTKQQDNFPHGMRKPHEEQAETAESQ